MWAAQRHDLELTTRLLKAGADPNLSDQSGLGPLQVALAALGPSPQATTAALAGGTFDTVLGPVEFDATGQNIHNAYALHIWQDGKFVEISKALR